MPQGLRVRVPPCPQNNEMRKFMINLPIEILAVYLPAFLFAVVLAIFVYSCGGSCFETFFHGYFSDVLIKNNFVYFFFLPITLYFVILISFRRKLSKNDFYKFLRSFLFVFGSIYLIMTLILLLTQMLFNTADPKIVASNSINFAWADFNLLGDFSWEFFEKIIPNSFEKFIFYSYFWLTPVSLITLFILIFRDKFTARRFLLSYFLAFLIGLPFWFNLPVLGPNMMFRVNQLQSTIPNEITNSINKVEFSETKKEVLKGFEDYYASDSYRSIDVSSFPSMHSAWGVIITLALYQTLGAFTLVATLPWLVALLIGTVFTLQHYFVDTIFGVLVGLLVWFLVGKFLKLEGKYFKDKYELFYSLELLENTTKNFLEKLKNKIVKVLF